MIRPLPRTIAISLILLSAALSRAADSPLVGHWEGVEINGTATLPMIMDIEMIDGKPEVSIGFPKNGIARHPVVDVKLDNTSVSGAYGFQQGFKNVIKGTLQGDELKGDIALRQMNLKFSLKRTAQSLPYTYEDVQYSSGDVKIAGVLVTPKTPGPHPAVVFVHGSGDSSRGPQWWNAEFFAKHGIASLVNDKRGSGESTGDWNKVGFQELADDAIAGVEFLKARQEIDPKRIGLWGISQAGWIEPIAAAKSSDISWMIVVSGGFVTVEREGYFDVEYRFQKNNRSKEELDEALAYLRMDNQVTRTGEGFKELVAKFGEVSKKPWFKDLGVNIPVPPNHVSREWYRRVMDIDHLPIVRSLNIPVLWFYGGQDNTFPAAEAAALANKMKSEDKKDFEVHFFPEADHGMRVAPPVQAFPFRDLSPDYVKAMEHWLAAKGISKAVSH